MALPIKKPPVTEMPTNNFGIPKGTHGRGGRAIQGVVLHCIPYTLEQYDAKACDALKIGRVIPEHASMHWMVGQSGAIHQYVTPDDVSWGFSDLVGQSSPNLNLFNWPLVTANPGISPDWYVLNIGIEVGTQAGGQCVPCNGATPLGPSGLKNLIRLLAWIKQTYNIPCDTDHIQFHQNIEVMPENECACADMNSLLIEACSYMESCDEPAPARGTVDTQKFMVVSPDGCVGYGYVHREGFLVGNGTVNDPLYIDYSLQTQTDLCKFGATLTTATLQWIVGLDANLCLHRADARTVGIQIETPWTGTGAGGIVVTPGGTNGHAPVISINFCQMTQAMGAGNAEQFIGVDINGCGVKSPIFTTSGIQGTGGYSNPIRENFDNLPAAPAGALPANTKIVISGGDGQIATASQLVDLLICQTVTAFGSISGSSVIRLLGTDASGACPVWITPVQIVDAGLTVSDTATVDMVKAGNDISANVKISASPGNAIVSHPDGVYAPDLCTSLASVPTGAVAAPGSLFLGSDCQYHAMPTLCTELGTRPTGAPAVFGTTILLGNDCQFHLLPVQTPLQVIDTDTINFTTSGADNHTITAVVNVASTAGNGLSVVPGAGLYVPNFCTALAARPTGTPGVAGTTLFLGSDCAFHALPAAVPETALNVIDTATVNLTASGTSNHTLQADVKLSATAGNVITANADGLYFNLCTTLATMALGAAGVAGTTQFIGADCQRHVLPAETPITVTDTSTVNLTASSTLNHTLQADVKVSATAGNSITVNADGLYVAVPVSPTWAGVAGDNISITPGGSLGHTPTIAVTCGTAAASNAVASLIKCEGGHMRVMNITNAGVCETPTTVLGNDGRLYTPAGIHAQQPRVSAETTYLYASGVVTAVGQTITGQTASITLTNTECYPRTAIVGLYGFTSAIITAFDGRLQTNVQFSSNIDWINGNAILGSPTVPIIIHNIRTYSDTDIPVSTPANGGPAQGAADTKFAILTVPAGGSITITMVATGSVVQIDNIAIQHSWEIITRLFGWLI